MCHKNWDAGYQICIPTLENRRLYLKLCTLYKIIYGYFYFPPNVLYHSQVHFFKIHPPYTNLLPTSIICSHHLFPEPFQFGTLFSTLPSLLLVLLPLGHMLHPLLVIMCPYPIHSVLFAYSLIAHTLYVTRVHTLISYIAITDMYLCIHCYRKKKFM